MKIRPLLIPFAVICAFAGTVAWLVLSDPPEAPKQQTNDYEPQKPVAATKELPRPSLAALPSAGTAQAAAAPAPGAIRDVSPDGVSAPEVTGTLTRIDPSKRYQELLNPPPEEIPDGPMDLIRVEVLDGGHLKSGRLTLKLAHITPLGLDATCKTQLGASWPCGTRARTFLRGLVRRLKVTCTKLEDLGPQKILAQCKRGTIDLSARMVQFGWAAATQAAPEGFQEMAETAKLEKIGQWQSDWYTDLPETDWVGQGPLEQLDLDSLSPDIVDWSLRTTPENDTWPGFESGQVPIE